MLKKVTAKRFFRVCVFSCGHPQRVSPSWLQTGGGRPPNPESEGARSVLRGNAHPFLQCGESFVLHHSNQQLGAITFSHRPHVACGTCTSLWLLLGAPSTHSRRRKRRAVSYKLRTMRLLCGLLALTCVVVSAGARDAIPIEFGVSDLFMSNFAIFLAVCPHGSSRDCQGDSEWLRGGGGNA